MKKLWTLTPKWIQAILVSAALLLPPLLLIQAVVGLNTEQILPAIPWYFPVVVGFLWLYWRFTTGQSFPFKASAKRQQLSRFSPEKSQNPFWTMVASVALFVMGLALLSVGLSFGNFTGLEMATRMDAIFELSPYLVIFLLLGMSLTAGIIEEVVFRGYLQSMLSDRYGRVISITVTAALFWFVHGLPLRLALPYMLISVGFSVLVESTKSIRPVVIVHVMIDFIGFGLGYMGVLFTAEQLAYNVFTDGVNGFVLAGVAIATVSGGILWFVSSKKLGMSNKETQVHATQNQSIYTEGSLSYAGD